MLVVEHLSKAYPGAAVRRVLNDVSLEVASGECVAIMGDSGVGKSTLLNIIAGLDVPDRGRVLIESIAINELDEEARTRLRRRRIGFVFQASHLLPHLTIAANVGLPLALNDMAGTAADERVQALLAAVGLADRAASFPRALSGGEMQRVAVARALVHRPALILADEPTGNLDAESAAEVLELLRAQSKESRAALLLVTHSPTAAQTMDRRLLLTRQGVNPLA
jgi:putative ABC transport system ATP-binding protein